MSVEVVPVGAEGSKDPVTPVGALPRLNVTAAVKLVRAIVTVVAPMRTQPEHGVIVAFVSDNEGHLIEVVEMLPKS